MAEVSMRFVADKLNKSVTTVIGLTAVAIGFSAAEVDTADVMYISVEGNAVRWAVGVTNPTASIGHAIAVGGDFTLRGRELIKAFQIVSQTGTATVHITLFSRG